jgi:cob(I)alamin adenosyltransferase
MLREFPSAMELVMTGREPSEFLCRIADYHSEIKQVKHPFEIGMRSRRGIEY